MQLLYSLFFIFVFFRPQQPVNGVLVPVTTQRLFAYERGKCEYSKTEIFGDLVRSKIGRFSTQPRTQSNLLQYDLYTPLNSQQRQILIPGNVMRLKYSAFNGKWPVRVIIHGWTGKSTTCYNAAIKDAYLSRGEYNVIIIDWSRQAADLSYVRVSKQLLSIAGSVAKFLRFLHDNTGVPFEEIYLVGHSAGSHISGLTGKWLNAAGVRLGAIFALDPAGLTQLKLGPNERLAPTDALYVESIHTDLKLLGNPLGTELSQAAIYVNWGRGQPHCPNATATELDFACDHFAAVFYFAESVRRPQLFGALRCNSIANVLTATCRCANNALACPAHEFMGGEPAEPKQGIFYLSTQSYPPYGTGNGMVYILPPRPSTIAKTSVFSRNG